MTETFKLATLPEADRGSCDLSFLSREAAEKVRSFHRSFPMYEITPLAHLPETAAELGLGDIYIKNEAYRFGLNAFKVLGGSYAIGNILAEKLGIPMEEVTFHLLTAPETRENLGDMTFITATDGNHGRGVAWSATRFGFPSVVYMPRGSAQERLENIRLAGADASILDCCYDDAVRLARRHAEENGWHIVQDTGWEGYTQVPEWIMQGYTTMGLEAWEQLPQKPTHIFLQAGVGSMAAAIAGMFANFYPEETPIIVVVEPNKADCFWRTADANDGKLHFVTEEMDTIMAGLACGEPYKRAWDILAACAEGFVSFPDYAAAKGMRILGNPMGDDDRVVSGESGASAFGCVAALMTDPELGWLREKLQLNTSSRVLFFNTEGATDRANYRRIVWDGKYPSK